MVNVVNNDIVPTVGRFFKKGEIVKIQNKITQQLIEKGVRQKKWKQP